MTSPVIFNRSVRGPHPLTAEEPDHQREDNPKPRVAQPACGGSTLIVDGLGGRARQKRDWPR